MQSISDLLDDLSAGDFSDKISDFNGKYVLLDKIRRLLKVFEQSQNAIGNILSAIQYMSQNTISADNLKQIADRFEQIADRFEQIDPPDDDDASSIKIMYEKKSDSPAFESCGQYVDETSFNRHAADKLPIETQTFDIRNPRAATYKSPVACAYKGTDIPFKGSWSSLLAKLAQKICEENPSGFERLLKKYKWVSKYRKPQNKSVYASIGSEFYIKVRPLSAIAVIEFIQRILIYCNIDYNEVVISCYPNNDSSQTAPFETCVPDADSESFRNKMADESIRQVLLKYYKYGFKLDSIEMMRFRRYAKEMDIMLPENDERLKEEILLCGTVSDNKLYCKNDELLAKLNHIVDEIFSDETKVIFYERLLSAYYDLLNPYGITSADLLKLHLKECNLHCNYAKNFMTNGLQCSESDAISSEIRRVWGDNASISIADLSERLPYIPREKIKLELSKTPLFLKTVAEEFFFIDKLIIAEEEAQAIADYANDRCMLDGHALLKEIPMEDLADANSNVSRDILQDAVYKKVLAGKYLLKSGVLTKKSELR